MKNANQIARILLGVAFVTFGLNFFFHFLPMPPSPEPMAKAMGAIYSTGYLFQFVKSVEILFGFMLIANFFTPLALVVLAPITVNILVAHLLLDPAGIVAGLVVAILHVYLGIQYLNYYRPMLVRKTE